jgi:hypothetical protein
LNEPGDGHLTAGAADYLQRRPRDRGTQGNTGAPAGNHLWVIGPGEVGQPNVPWQDQRQFSHHPFPIKAAVGEFCDGCYPLVMDVLELGICGEAGSLRLRYRVFPFELGHLYLAFGDLIAGGDEQRHAGEGGDQGADDDVSDGATSQRGAPPKALLNGDEIDRAHAY